MVAAHVGLERGMIQYDDGRTVPPTVDRFIGWVRTEALPTWAGQGFDTASDRFHERLDGAGRPLLVPHRAMVQARQIYVYAHAANLGWYRDGTTLAMRAMMALQRDFCVEAEGGLAVRFSIDPATGRPHSDRLDAYTHAFVLFAAAFLYRATGETALLSFADRIAGFVDRKLADPVAGGLLTDADNADAEKLQNPQMHLLEAWLALADAAPDGPWLERAGNLVALFRDHMLARPAGILPERFAPDWGPHPDPKIADVFEPGHHFEWIWLLRWYETLTGVDLADCRAVLLVSATQPTATRDGLIIDQLGGNGRVVRDAHRLWPHCEAIKAATASPLGLADPASRQLAGNAADGLLRHFLGSPFPGGWTDQIEPTHAPIVDYVPASSLYHLMLAAAVADDAVQPVHARTP
jgi:mannose-6-phosphate isomerase